MIPTGTRGGTRRRCGEGSVAPQATRAAGRLAALALAAATVFGAATAHACRTPVFRYAMYHWAAAPYYVFYFHHGPQDEADAPLHEAIREWGFAEAAPANVLIETVNADDPEQLDKLPRVVVEAWRERDDGRAPVHLVYTAWGEKLFAGRLDRETLAAMVDSPARRKLGERLHTGNAAVLLVLSGEDPEANQRAEKAVDAVVADAEAGKFVVDMGIDDYREYMPPRSESPEADEPPERDAPTKSHADPIRLAKVIVSRQDAAERWLVESLMAVESDLGDYAAEPMVFAVYGRGRAMPPYVGRGVTPENLAEVVHFLSGPCSCMVKEQNPGMDLLMPWNWDATAEAWAATDPEMSADPWSYDERLEAARRAADVRAAQTGEIDDEALAAALALPSPGEGTSPGGEAATTGPDSDSPTRQVLRESAGEAPSALPADAASSSFSVNLAWTVGLGVAGLAILVVVAGFVMMRWQ